MYRDRLMVWTRAGVEAYLRRRNRHRYLLVNEPRLGLLIVCGATPAEARDIDRSRSMGTRVQHHPSVPAYIADLTSRIDAFEARVGAR